MTQSENRYSFEYEEKTQVVTTILHNNYPQIITQIVKKKYISSRINSYAHMHLKKNIS